MDIELDRSTASNWKEYFNELRDMWDTLIWVWEVFINSNGKKIAKIMFWMFVFNHLLNVVYPWALSMVFDGLNPKLLDLNLIIVGISLWILVVLAGVFMHHKKRYYRKKLIGENLRELDYQTTKLFFEKSLGTHIDENNLLNEANLKKGYERIFHLENMMLFEGIEAVLSVLLPYLALWILDYKVACAISVNLILYFAWSLLLNQKMMRDGIPIDKKWRDMNRFRVERLDQIERVKTNNKEGDELDELTRQFNDIIVPDRKLWLWFVTQTSRRSLLNYIFLFLVMTYGVYLAFNGKITLGLLFPLFTWTKQLSDNLWIIGDLEHEINFVTPSILALKNALTLPIGLSKAKNPNLVTREAPCRIEFRNIKCEYQENNTTTHKKIKVLDNVSFIIEPGEKAAMIGSSGAGKTTIMRLLLRFMDPTSGEILIDGKDLRDIDLGSWLDIVGYVPQQAQILDGTIRYNLLYGLPPETSGLITGEEFQKMANTLQINFGERLIHGLDTVVGRNGIKLSGGQAQRIMIGAAVMKNPRFLIIDEATNSLDATTEKLVQVGLEKVLTKDRGALIITHRLNTVRRICDKFIVINGNGQGSRVVAIAQSFEELAEKSAEFRILAHDQGIII